MVDDRDTLRNLNVKGVVNKASAWLAKMSKGTYESSGGARHRSVYM